MVSLGQCANHCLFLLGSCHVWSFCPFVMGSTLYRLPGWMAQSYCASSAASGLTPHTAFVVCCSIVRRLLFKHRVHARRRAKRHARRSHRRHQHTSSIGDLGATVEGVADAAGAADSTTGLVQQEAVRGIPGGKQCGRMCCAALTGHGQADASLLSGVYRS